jgi:hypothetical protein
MAEISEVTFPVVPVQVAMYVAACPGAAWAPRKSALNPNDTSNRRAAIGPYSPEGQPFLLKQAILRLQRWDEQLSGVGAAAAVPLQASEAELSDPRRHPARADRSRQQERRELQLKKEAFPAKAETQLGRLGWRDRRHPGVVSSSRTGVRRIAYPLHNSR